MKGVSSVSRSVCFSTEWDVSPPAGKIINTAAWTVSRKKPIELQLEMHYCLEAGAWKSIKGTHCCKFPGDPLECEAECNPHFS